MTYEKTTVRDPRVDTHSLCDVGGVIHQPVKIADNVWGMFCDFMDAIAELPRNNDITLGPEPSVTYTDASLVISELTCVRCASGLEGWKNT